MFNNDLLTQVLLIICTGAIGWCIATINHVKSSLSELKIKVDDLWEWHKPDTEGRMGWKGDLEFLRSLSEKVDLLVDIVKDFIHESKLQRYSDESRIEKLVEGNEAAVEAIDKLVEEERETRELLKDLARDTKASKRSS